MVFKFSIERLPSRELSPNWKGHWSKFHKAMQMDKQDAHAYFLHQCEKPEKPFAKATVTITSYVKAKRKRDDENWRARFKGMMDGLSGLVWEDDSVDCIGHPEHIIIVAPEKAGREGLVEFLVEEA